MLNARALFTQICGSAIVLSFAAYSAQAASVDVPSTTSALRMANAITGGSMPPTDPIFAQMVTQIQAGSYYNAALLASQSKYFNVIARRMAREMQNVSLNAAGVPDNDATTFIVGHFMGIGGSSPVAPSISSLWSDNATYTINVSGTSTHAMSMTLAQLNAVNCSTSLIRTVGQTASNDAGTASVAIPAADVGGYTTLSDRASDSSYAQNGLTAGTNLRFIEGIWEISMGLTLLDMASTDATAAVVPRFVPENDPNFLVGQGQPACISCHGGGASSLNHGYSAVADLFDFNPAGTTGVPGIIFIASPTTTTMKSLGSNQANRAATLTCNLAKGTVCNPDSMGADDVNHSWDVAATWSQNGLLSQMGWSSSAPTSGDGLQALGAAIGQAALVYENLVTRTINEICPLGSFSEDSIENIAGQGQAADDMRVIVALVASDPSCR